MGSLKFGLCPLCNDGNLQPLIAGVCKIHYWRNLRNNSKRLERNYKKKPEEVKILPWYIDRISEMTGFCQECAAPIDLWNFKIALSSCAHILPKEKNFFPSIANHPLNFMELGANCGCHFKWDKRWQSASAYRMKVFPLAKERFMQFESCIDSEERRRIPEIFLI